MALTRISVSADIPADTEILVNATCVGLFPDVDAYPDINYEQITSDMVVADVIFNPIEPLFIKKAADKGAKVVPGIAMLVDQGVIGFKCWTGVDPSREIMMYAVIYHSLEIGSVVACTTLRPVNIFIDNVDPVASRILMTNVQLTFDRLLSLTMA